MEWLTLASISYVAVNLTFLNLAATLVCQIRGVLQSRQLMLPYSVAALTAAVAGVADAVAGNYGMATLDALIALVCCALVLQIHQSTRPREETQRGQPTE
jgi:O-antigen/teichoic acid export membrane protein